LNGAPATIADDADVALPSVMSMLPGVSASTAGANAGNGPAHCTV
jgi:hypothetical protein